MSSTREIAEQFIANYSNYTNPVDAIEFILRQRGGEHEAALIRRDGFMCEAHPGREFEHDPECAGPGMPWVIEGKEAIIDALRQREQEVRERVVGRFMAIVKGIKGPNVPRVDLYEAMLVAGREILRRDSEQEGEQPK